MDILKRLKRVEESPDNSQQGREESFRQLKSELETHSEAEEKVFYTRLDREPRTKEMMAEAREEHQLATEILLSLERMSRKDEQWMARMKVLQENVEHHIDEEESEIFGEARSFLGRDELEQLGEEFDRARENLPRAEVA
jgi:hemerythrin-like domain-containing protein